MVRTRNASKKEDSERSEFKSPGPKSNKNKSYHSVDIAEATLVKQAIEQKISQQLKGSLSSTVEGMAHTSQELKSKPLTQGSNRKLLGEATQSCSPLKKGLLSRGSKPGSSLAAKHQQGQRLSSSDKIASAHESNYALKKDSALVEQFFIRVNQSLKKKKKEIPKVLEIEFILLLGRYSHLLEASEGIKAAKEGVSRFLASASFDIDKGSSKSPQAIGEDLVKRLQREYDQYKPLLRREQSIEEVKFIPDSLRSQSPSTFEILPPSMKQPSLEEKISRPPKKIHALKQLSSLSKQKQDSSLKGFLLGKRAAPLGPAPANLADPENLIDSRFGESSKNKSNAEAEDSEPSNLKRQKIDGTDQIVSLANSSSDQVLQSNVVKEPSLKSSKSAKGKKANASTKSSKKQPAASPEEIPFGALKAKEDPLKLQKAKADEEMKSKSASEGSRPDFSSAQKLKELKGRSPKDEVKETLEELLGRSEGSMSTEKNVFGEKQDLSFGFNQDLLHHEEEQILQHNGQISDEPTVPLPQDLHNIGSDRTEIINHEEAASHRSNARSANLIEDMATVLIEQKPFVGILISQEGGSPRASQDQEMKTEDLNHEPESGHQEAESKEGLAKNIASQDTEILHRSSEWNFGDPQNSPGAKSKNVSNMHSQETVMVAGALKQPQSPLKPLPAAKSQAHLEEEKIPGAEEEDDYQVSVFAIMDEEEKEKKKKEDEASIALVSALQEKPQAKEAAPLGECQICMDEVVLDAAKSDSEPRQEVIDNLSNFEFDEQMDDDTKKVMEAFCDDEEKEQIRLQRQENINQQKEYLKELEEKRKKEKANKVFFMTACEHIFHGDCLRQYYTIQVDEGKLPLICPIVNCKKETSPEDVRQLLDDDYFQKYSSRSLNRLVDTSPDLSWCPSANCQVAFIFNDGEDPEYLCRKCGGHYCLDCRAEFHSGQTCKEYQISSTKSKDDVKFLEFVRGKKFKMCAKCKFWVERTAGCNHMRCRCGNDFCYICGGVYGDCQCSDD